MSRMVCLLLMLVAGCGVGRNAALLAQSVSRDAYDNAAEQLYQHGVVAEISLLQHRLLRAADDGDLSVAEVERIANQSMWQVVDLGRCMEQVREADGLQDLNRVYTLSQQSAVELLVKKLTAASRPASQPE